MNSAPSPNSESTFQIMNSESKLFTLKFCASSAKLGISINNNYSMFLSYKVSFNLEELHKLNKFFRQFDTIEEIYDFIINIENIEEKISIITEEKYINLKFTLPSISKKQTNTEITFVVPPIEVKESDLILKLCEKVEKIDILEKKVKYLFSMMGKNEKDFYIYEDCEKKIHQNIKKLDSKIITPDDFIIVSFGIKEKLNKMIKDVKLLYRSSRDGDSTQFHTKCDGKENTVTFVKSKNGRKFGGFANKAFHSSNGWISDPNAFVFSLDLKECYYYNNVGNMIYGSSSYGPLWGSGHDLYLASGCMSNTTSTTNQESFDYKNRVNALSGSTNFQVEDCESYELIFE